MPALINSCMQVNLGWPYYVDPAYFESYPPFPPHKPLWPGYTIALRTYGSLTYHYR